MADAAGDWKVAALLRSGDPAVWERLPGMELPGLLAAAGIDVMVRGADKLMVRVAVDGVTAEDAEASADEQLRAVPLLQELTLASVSARKN